ISCFYCLTLSQRRRMASDMSPYFTTKTYLTCLASISLFAMALPLMVGCGGGSVGVGGDDLTRKAPQLRYGGGYGWVRPSLTHVKAEGYTFVARYLSYDTTGKNLTAIEANALKAAGIDIVSSWEWGPTDALDGFQRGVEHAQAAQSQATACGMPA